MTLWGAGMKSRNHVSAVAAALLLVANQAAIATTITFDEFSANNNNTAITNLYAPLGVVFGLDNSSTWSGLSQGDPGNWKLEGSNGTAFLGNNGINNNSAYITSINFSSLMSNVSFDISRSNGSSVGQILTASAYGGTTLLSSKSIMFGAINSWTSIAFGMGGISSLIIASSATGFSPFGLDNLQFNATNNLLVSGIIQPQVEVSAIPEPETYALMIAGLGLLGFLSRRKINHPTTA
jgi:uncharacterized membrane protein